MNYVDLREDIQQWQSEEIIIPYYDPIKKKRRRYYPDFLIKYKNSKGHTITELIEIKPYKEVIGPPEKPKRKTKSWMYAVQTYINNQAKWKAAEEYCENRGWRFRIITENELGINHK